MHRLHVVTPLAMVVLGGLAYVAVSANTSSPQTQQNKQDADLNAKVERLEKQVEQLQNKVKQLERRSAPTQLYVQPSPGLRGPILTIPAPQRNGNGVPPGSTPFNFNGGTYYMMPVEKANKVSP